MVTIGLNCQSYVRKIHANLNYIKMCFSVMKSSLPEADRHDENVTHWYDYPKCEIPCPTTGGHVAFKNQIINR
jgi:hypothetical protein